jgi:hypothetical protein
MIQSNIQTRTHLQVHSNLVRATRARKTRDRAVHAVRVNAFERRHARPPVGAICKHETDAVNGIGQRRAALGVERKDASHLGNVLFRKVRVRRVIVSHNSVKTVRRGARGKHGHARYETVKAIDEAQFVFNAAAAGVERRPLGLHDLRERIVVKAPGRVHGNRRGLVDHEKAVGIVKYIDGRGSHGWFVAVHDVRNNVANGCTQRGMKQ